MRKHGVTIRELASRMQVTMKRVREVRALDRVDYLHYCDYTQAVTGTNVFSRARYDAMLREERALRGESHWHGHCWACGAADEGDRPENVCTSCGKAAMEWY
jgi:hypothetical protein